MKPHCFRRQVIIRIQRFFFLTVAFIIAFMAGADAFGAPSKDSWVWPRRPSEEEINAAVQDYIAENISKYNQVPVETIVEKFHEVKSQSGGEGEPGTYNNVFLIIKSKYKDGSADVNEWNGRLAYDYYKEKFFFHVTLQDFYDYLDGGYIKKGWIDAQNAVTLKGTLSVRQKLHPPARVLDIKFNREMLDKLTGRGTADLYLDFKLDNIPGDIDTKITVDFEIDPPSSLLGNAKGIEVKDGKASVPFKFTKSEAQGQGGIIYGKVKYPSSIELVNGKYIPSQKQNTAVVKIKPLCEDASSIFYKDNLISDNKYDLDDLQKQFLAVIDKYGAGKLTASSYSNAGLVWFLAHPGGEMAGMKIQYYAGNEVQFQRYIQEEGKKGKLTPSELFGKALEMNKGDVTKAFLLCHNVLRAAARGGEDFSSQFSKEEMDLMKKSASDGLTKEQVEKKNSLLTMQGGYKNTGIYDYLEELRPGSDNMGAWYHMFGTASLTCSSRVTPPLSGIFEDQYSINDPSNIADAVIWAEEYLISGDIYSDPNEYCVDMMGAKLGRYVRDKAPGTTEVMINKTKGYINDFGNYLSTNRGNKTDYIDRMAIYVRCPVTTTITDRVTKKYFKFDQSKNTFEGDLPVRFRLNPEGRYFSLLAFVPGNDIDIICEPVANGKFSLMCYDFESETAADYGTMYISPGFDFSTSISKGDMSQGLKDDSGSIVNASITKIDQGIVNEIRKRAKDHVLAERGITDNTLKKDNPAEKVSIPKDGGLKVYAVLFISAGVVLAVLIIILSIFLLRGRRTNLCPYCGSPVEKNMIFCTVCGRRVK